MTAAAEPIPKICKNCGKEYLAYRSTGITCSSRCSSQLYKKKQRIKKQIEGAEMVRSILGKHVYELSHEARDEITKIVDVKIIEHNSILFEKIKRLILTTIN